MLFHMSIAADDPRRVANAIAELWNGYATPFPPVAEGSWIAHAADDRNSAIEVYPRGTELHEGDDDADAVGLPGRAPRHGATHMAIATPFGRDVVMALALREGWPAKYRRRGGAFGVIELWIEGCQMVEVLTPVMQQEYRDAMRIDRWMDFLDRTVREPA